MNIQAKTFIGCLLNYELRLHLNKSAQWKEDKMLGTLPLSEIRRKEKDYIGFLLPSPIPYPDLIEKECEVKKQLQIYCPKLNLEPHSIYVFSQIFLG